MVVTGQCENNKKKDVTLQNVCNPMQKHHYNIDALKAVAASMGGQDHGPPWDLDFSETGDVTDMTH